MNFMTWLEEYAGSLPIIAQADDVTEHQCTFETLRFMFYTTTGPCANVFIGQAQELPQRF